MPLILSLFVLFATAFAVADEPLLSIKEMRALDSKEHQSYLIDLRKMLAQTGESDFSLISLKGGPCEGAGTLTCQPAFYGPNRCVRYPMGAHKHCMKKKGKDEELHLQFVENKSIQSSWGKLSSTVKKYCLKKKNESACKKWQKQATLLRRKYAL